MSGLDVAGLVKSFGSTPVLRGITFEAADGEFLTMLGPSGCGKSTILMCIAGLQDPDEGSIRCGDQPFFDRSHNVNLPAENRDLGVVFQSYAVWPHMTVFENVAFPLKLRKVPRQDLRRRVQEALELVEIEHHSKKYPHELSGGQQQRVAIARALSFSPRFLLLDEPFSNLDAKLRERARESVRRLQKQLGLTTILVTHDQGEALSMSDRVLVMNEGQILQTGTPEEVYQRPATPFVAEFVGSCNFIRAEVISSPAPGCLDVLIDGTTTRLRLVHQGTHPPSAQITVAIRPEAIRFVDVSEASGEEDLQGWVETSVFLGDHYRHTIRVAGLHLVVVSAGRITASEVALDIPPEACTVVAWEPARYARSPLRRSSLESTSRQACI